MQYKCQEIPNPLITQGLIPAAQGLKKILGELNSIRMAISLAVRGGMERKAHPRVPKKRELAKNQYIKLFKQQLTLFYTVNTRLLWGGAVYLH